MKESLYEQGVVLVGDFILKLFMHLVGALLTIVKCLKKVWKTVLELAIVVILFIIEKQAGGGLSITIGIGVLMSLLICWAFSHLFAKLGVPMKGSFIPFSMAFAYFLYVFVTVKGIPFGWRGCFSAIGIYLLLSCGATLIKAAYRNFRKGKEDSEMSSRRTYAVAYVLLAVGCMFLALFLLGMVVPAFSCVYHLYVGLAVALIGFLLVLFLVFKEF